MSAVIDMSNDRENMAYVGQKPWHGLGVELDENTDIDEWKIAAGMNFTVNRTPVVYHADDDVHYQINDQHVLYRSDTKLDFGVVSNRYKIVQPDEVIEFYRDLTATYGFEMETAGCLDGGKRIWALARTGSTMRIKGQDQVDGYLLLATSYDRSIATRASFTTVRVVCNNTLSMAYRSMADFVSVRHSAHFDSKRVKEDLNIYESNFDILEDDIRMLADVKIKQSEATKFLMELMAGTRDIDKLSTRKANQVAAVYNLFDGKGQGSELTSAKNTYWGLVNAVTEYVDHHSGAHNANNRLRDAWFGRGEKMKNDAMKKAYNLAKVA